MEYDIGEGEVCFILKANVTDGEWDGTFSTGLVFDAENPTAATGGGLEVAVTLSAFLDYLHDNPDFIDELDEYREDVLKSVFPEAYEAALAELEETEPKYETEGNVIKLNRWSKTYGSA